MRAARRGIAIRVASALSALSAAGCAAAAAPGAGERFRPPPPLALVAIVDPRAADAAAELGQLETVIQAGVTPSETLVVSLLAGPPPAGTYLVRAGDSMTSIAAGSGVSLAALEAANPQLGPLAHRDWNRVYAGDRVTIPTAQAAASAAAPVVARAPAGAPPPVLAGRPARPASATPFQDAQYRRALAAADSANAARVAAWRAETARQLRPWQARVAARLRALAASLGVDAVAPGAGDVAAAIQAAANTLTGLPGRRVLLLLAGDRVRSVQDVTAGGSLAGIHLVLANLVLANLAVAGAGVPAPAAGATVTALDPALTELQLVSVING